MTAAAQDRPAAAGGRREAAAEARSLGKRSAGVAGGAPGPRRRREGEAATFEEMMQANQARLDAYRQRCIAELVATGTRLELAAYRAAVAVSPGVEFCSDGLVERLARRLGASAQAEIDAATPGPTGADDAGSRAVAVRVLDPGATATRQRRIEMWEEVERSALLDRSAADERAARARSWAAELDAAERPWAVDEGGEGGEGESVRARRGQKPKGYFHAPETKDALWEAFSAVAATPAGAELGFVQSGAGWVMPARARMTTQFCDVLREELTPRLRRVAPELLKLGFLGQVSDYTRKWFLQADGVTLSRAGRCGM